MAKYLLLIHGVDEQWEAMTPEQAREHDAAHRRFREAGRRPRARRRGARGGVDRDDRPR
jgi:hypothetical protein